MGEASSPDTEFKYFAGNDERFAGTLSERTVQNSVTYILPVLDSLPPNFTMLDVGCGPASITIDLARRYPLSTILALDHPSTVEIARIKVREAGVSNIFFASGDALDIQAVKAQPGFDAVDGGCDVVHTHMVHMHVQDAPKLMRELRMAAKPQGGVVCCKEYDLGMSAIWPEFPASEKARSRNSQVMLDRGQDPFVARKLFSNALAAGFKRENAQPGLDTWFYTTPSERQAWANFSMSSAQMFQQASWDNGDQVKGSPYEDMSKVRQDWQDWANSEDGWYAGACPFVICRRDD